MKQTLSWLAAGRCVTSNFGYLSCQRDVLPELQSACSARHACQLRVDDTAFRRVQPCHRDLKSYLTVTYRCAPGTRCRYYYYYFIIIIIIIILAHHHKAAGSKTRLDIQNYGCIGK